jgi:CheY-like chemotaxis protein
MVKSYLTGRIPRSRPPTARSSLFVTRDERPDLIILDLMMPELGGYDFISAYAREGNARHHHRRPS